VVRARPYDFPHDGGLDPRDTALLLIDMQADFLDPGGYLAAMGADVSATRAAIAPAQRLLAAARNAGLAVFHTRQGHQPDLSDLTDFAAWRSRRGGAPIGSPGPLGRILVRGEPGWQIVPDLAPRPGETVIDKTANGAFCDSDLEVRLRTLGIRRLLVAGITTEVCVHSTIREAGDRGFACLMVEDACASGDPAMHRAAVAMMETEGGVFGAVAPVDAVVAALDALNAGPRLSEGGQARREDRRARQAEALRANLQRRKAQARGRGPGAAD
jgi:nicotinamidase-related amidase